MVSLAHSLNLKVVAEGVETGEQLEFLKAVGCDQYQGYHFSPALSATEFANLMREQTRPVSERDTAPTESRLARLR
ncbi:MAG: EAL domain-containing protein [Gammaproteobacteria bacterium]|nr:MAG: EAL domain-containing protein [Gammaproteobacteria bacterium]